ncbi:MAG TPA: hypothetical protein VLZ74_05815 [Methylocella sp.]|nr:hypothetical protein [Methylocella sp.]
MPLELCLFKLKDDAGTVAVNPEAVQFVRDAGTGSVTIVLADNYEIVVEGKIEDVTDKLQRRS